MATKKRYQPLPILTLVDVDGNLDDPEGTTLELWWSDLSDAQRREIFGLAPRNPMPRWMVYTLRQAEVAGLVERADQPAYMPPWIEMPEDVARLVARRRRRG